MWLQVMEIPLSPLVLPGVKGEGKGRGKGEMIRVVRV